MKRLAPLPILLLAATAGAVLIDVHEPSSMAIDGSVSIGFQGTLIGDWDPEGNPDGTQTRPGVWGGSGNNPIDIELGFSFPMSVSGDLVGAIDFELGEVPGTCIVDGVQLALPSDSGTGSVTVSMLFETFRSIDPDSLYIGGIPFELPIGDAQMTDVAFAQNLPGDGTADPDPDLPGVWNVLLTVPGMLTGNLSLMEMDMPVEVPLTLVLTGTYTHDEAGVELHLTAAMDVDETTELPDMPLPDIPFELPTILPPGDFAGVVLSLTPQDMNINMALDVVVHGTGTPSHAPGDADGDGLVNTNDILAVLSAWGPCDGCTEDLDGDGMVGVDEILLIIEHWG